MYKAMKECWYSNNKINCIIKYKNIILGIFACLTVILGLIGYNKSSLTTGWMDIFNNTIALFLFAWPDDNNIYLDGAKFFAILTVFLGLISIFLKSVVDTVKSYTVQKSEFTLLIGLSRQNSAFLESEKDNISSILIIESDPLNPNIEYFRTEGFAVIVAKADIEIEKIKLNKLKEAIISTGDDKQNIALAMQILEYMNNKDTENHKKIFVRVDNRNMSVLLRNNIIKNQKNVDIIVHSLYENMAKELFRNHSLLGRQADIVKTNEVYNIILVGSSMLVTELIYHILILANLPKENTLNLFLLDPNAVKFYEKVKNIFHSIEKIPSLNIYPMDIDSDMYSFYNNDVWKLENLTNIIIATELEQKNLDIAINLQNITYLKETVKETFKTEVLIAIYKNYGLKEKITNDKNTFSNFSTFADIKNVSNRENLIDEKLDFIAKLVHANYLNDEKVSIENLNKKWMDDHNDNKKERMNTHKRASSRSQALHLDTKLLALGLERHGPVKISIELKQSNEKIFRKQLEDIGDDYEKFPEVFSTLLSKLAKSEHNRWNTFHFLNGWVYDIERDDDIKRHDCLIPFNEFKTDDLKNTYQYDVESVLNIPNYLTQAGYKLVKITNKK